MKVIDIADRRRIYFETKERELQCSILMTLAGFVAAVVVLVFQIRFEWGQLYHYIFTFFLLIYFSFNLYSNNKLSKECSKVNRKWQG
ncbi:hypothetical protein P9027_29895 [Bacillus thuringiensis]|uniref:hypothetical protein n=1 Tax=Bacillus thuringiensis TaxID=1428 RepID=UPI002DBCE45C|nr:hypothetical protein [Bacillus thuringiensis]MEC3226133.1 hypothetical protein [Bacillus thuringiensis]MEC3463215.1 hypothetical protein [Bacillus thuringiensis]MEC3556335.1 hypothetical protein [Bacillus thuringiensis]MED2058899.1 hypothetical protein [Bacillus thuringiensis]